MPNIMKKALFTWKSLRKLSAEERIKAEQTIEQLETVATEYDVEFVSSIKRGWPSLVRNQSHKTILRHAEKNNIDLIVMRTHKRKIPNIISKDISRRVIVNSAIPVIAHPDQS